MGLFCPSGEVGQAAALVRTHHSVSVWVDHPRGALSDEALGPEVARQDRANSQVALARWSSLRCVGMPPRVTLLTLNCPDPDVHAPFPAGQLRTPGSIALTVPSAELRLTAIFRF